MNSTPQELKLLDSTTTTTTTTDNTPTATISHQQSQLQQLIASAVTPSLVTVLTQSPLPSSSSPTCPNNNNHIFVVDNDNDSSFDANFDEDRKIVQMVSGLTHTFLLDKKGRVFGDLPNSLFQPLSPSSTQQEQVNKFITDNNKNSKNRSSDTTKTIQWRHAKWFDDKHICKILSGYYYLILVSITTSGETSEMNHNNNYNNNKVTFYHFDYRNHSKISMRRWTSDEVPPLRHLLSSPTTTTTTTANTYWSNNCNGENGENGENSPISPIAPSSSSCLSNHMASGAYHTIVLTHESRNNCYGFIHSPFQAPTYDELPTVSHHNLFMQVHVQKRVLPHLNHPLLTNERIVQVVAGYRMTFLLSDRGELFVCGVNVDGCLFLGRTSASESLKRVTGLKGVVRRVWCGYRHAMIQLTDGRYFVCGANDQQQLSFVDNYHYHGHYHLGSDHGHHAAAVVDHHGSGHDSSHHHQMTMIVQPVQVTLPEHTTHVELSGFRTLFTTSTGRVYCYGGQPQHTHSENIGNPSLSTNTFCGSNSSPAVVSSPVATNRAVLVMEQPPSMMMMTASTNRRANGNGSRSDDGDDGNAQCTTMTAEEDPARRMQQRPSQSQQSQNVLRMTSGGLAAQFYYTERSPDYDHLAPQLHLAVDLKSV